MPLADALEGRLDPFRPSSSSSPDLVVALSDELAAWQTSKQDPCQFERLHP